MVSGTSFTLRESSSSLMHILRISDGLVVSLLVFVLVYIHGVTYADHYETLMLLSFLLSMSIFSISGLYQPWRGQGIIKEFTVIFKSWVIMVSVILLLLFSFKTAHQYSRAVLLSWFLATPFVVGIKHAFIRNLLRAARAKGKNQRTAVIVGAGDLGLKLRQYIEAISWTGIQILGFFDDHKTNGDLSNGGIANRSILGKTNELREYLEQHQVDYVYIALPMRAERKIHEILRSCRTLGARLYLVPDFMAFKYLNTQIQRLGDVLLLDFNPNSSSKRFFDVTFSLALISFTLPLTFIIALTIKLQDSGPILYGHHRVSAAGKTFSCLKFRTMVVDADRKLLELLQSDESLRLEWEKTYKLKNDPRVTWIGRFLRRTSLDELPQFLNVLKGEMSVVGARPIVRDELTCYYKENGGLYCSMKPGITGPWQIMKRSDTQNYNERVALDSWYVLNSSIILDLKIILKTIGSMISGKGAY